MLTDIPEEQIKEYVAGQLNSFFPDGDTVCGSDEKFSAAFEAAMKRLAGCFEHITVRGYTKEDGRGGRQAYFQHTNSDQYCQFLWFFSNTLWNMYPECRPVCDKLILLNKTLHGCWYTYKVQLPDIFILVHPVGSVIGHAIYSNYLVVCQNVTIGERVGAKKRIGRYCFLASGATIMGDGEIGDNVSIGINTTVYKEDIEPDSVVFVDKVTGQRRTVKTGKESRAHMYFC